MTCTLGAPVPLSSIRSRYPTSTAGSAGEPVRSLIAYRMNRTPGAGAPARAVVSYWSVVKFHSKVLPISAGGMSAAMRLLLRLGRDLAQALAPAIPRAYDQNFDQRVNRLST